MLQRNPCYWYGENIPGGAESECRRTAENLRDARVDVEVLTTCAKDAYNWQNHHKPGDYAINNVPIKHFKVNKRDEKDFNNVNEIFMSNISMSGIEDTHLINPF